MRGGAYARASPSPQSPHPPTAAGSALDVTIGQCVAYLELIANVYEPEDSEAARRPCHFRFVFCPLSIARNSSRAS